MGNEERLGHAVKRDSAADISTPATPAEDFEPGQQASDEALQKLQEENKRLLDQLLRKQAEQENFRKRSAREREDFLQYSLAEAVKSLLPVLDGFDRALESNGSAEDYRRGVELIHQQLRSALEKLGLRTLEAQGSQFDPHLHEAVAIVESTTHPDHQIMQEVQRGYWFKDRLLRPALVKVAKKPEEGTAASDTGDVKSE